MIYNKIISLIQRKQRKQRKQQKQQKRKIGHDDSGPVRTEKSKIEKNKDLNLDNTQTKMIAEQVSFRYQG